MDNLYGLTIGTAIIVCIVISSLMAQKRGYYKDLVFDICLVCIPIAILGARIYYVIFDELANPNTWDFVKFLGFGENGLRGFAIYGGLIGAIIGGFVVEKFVVSRRKKDEQVSFIQMADLAFVVIILGQAIGRWGNFFNQEAYGSLVTDPNLQFFPYAVQIAAEGNQWFLATFFYESMWNLAGFALLFFLYNGKYKSFDGFIFAVYCIFYGVGRFFIESLRSDSLMLGTFRVSQLVSLGAVLFGIIMILVHMYRARESGKLPFILVDQSKLGDNYYRFCESFLSRPPIEKTKGDEADDESDYDNDEIEDDRALEYEGDEIDGDADENDERDAEDEGDEGEAEDINEVTYDG